MARKTATAVVNSAREAIAEHRGDSRDIAALAYSLWMARGCPMGSPDEDWFAAEAQLSATTELEDIKVPEPEQKAMAATA